MELYVTDKTGTADRPEPKSQYPTFNQILETANKINKFVSVDK